MGTSGGRLRRTVYALLSMLYPEGCPLCGQSLDLKSQAGVCSRCWGNLVPFTSIGCPRCGRPEEDGRQDEPCLSCQLRKEPFDSARSWARYEGEVAGILRRLKYGRSDVLARPLVEQVLQAKPIADWMSGADLLTPVPLHWFRRCQRGYDQAALLCNLLSSHLGLPVCKVLRRRSSTRPQVGLDAPARRENMKGAFGPGPDWSRIRGKKVCLVDDVWTTGATAREAARVIRRAGPREIRVFSIARA